MDQPARRNGDLYLRRAPSEAQQSRYERGAGHHGYSTDGKIAVSSNAYARDSVFVDSTGWADSLVTRFTPFSNNQRRFRRHYTKTALHQPDYVYIQGGITGGLNPVAFATKRYEWHATTGLLSRVTVNGSGPNITRNGELQQSGAVMPSGATATVGHSTSHDPFSVRWSPTAMDNLERSYGLGDVGRIIKEIRPYSPSHDYQQSFSYDSLGRYTRVKNSYVETTCTQNPPHFLLGYTCSGWAETPLDSANYRYDAAHNRIADSVWIASQAPVTTDALVYSTGNRLTNRAGYTYTYDLDGNLTKKVRTAGPDSVLYTWSADGLLRQVTSGSLTVAYDYDAGGKLVRKSRNGVLERHFLWDGGQMIAELDGSATTRIGEYAYYPGADRPLALITGATAVTATRYYQQDGMGNVIGLYTSNDAVVFTQEYASWGSVGGIAPNTARDTSRLRWKGLMFEGDSAKLYYMRARWYDPEAGRFVSEDPIGLAGGINQYAFAGGDPVNGWDPSGTQSCRYLVSTVSSYGQLGSSSGASEGRWYCSGTSFYFFNSLQGSGPRGGWTRLGGGGGSTSQSQNRSCPIRLTRAERRAAADVQKRVRLAATAGVNIEMGAWTFPNGTFTRVATTTATFAGLGADALDVPVTSVSLVHYHLQANPVFDVGYASVSKDDILYIQWQRLDRIIAVSRDSLSLGTPDGGIVTCAR